MNIGTAAARSGVPAKTIRYYEEIGLMPKAGRTASGYRAYTQTDVDMLRFIQRARSLGFSVKDVGDLLTLWRDRERASADVRRIAQGHMAEVERKIAELETIRRTLQSLIERCHGDHRPDCPILDELAPHCCD
ncbi:MAG: Cu(I)-responsive transcriptional regulator [Magnetospirillum sp.]|nr:Cu(I)-responsive transcriptional regulator [Magnetospirillum sp.]